MIEDCVKKVGYDIDLIKSELERYNDIQIQVTYLVRLEDEVWKTLADVDNVFISLEKHIEKHIGSKNFNIPNKSKILDMIVFDFIDRQAKKVKDEKAKTILFCIRDLCLGKTFLEADQEFEHWINELGEVLHYLNFEIEKREIHLPSRLESRIKKLYWMGSEEFLIDMFEQFKSKEIWEYGGDKMNAIAHHFSIDKRETIPIKSELPFQKINWLFEPSDLARWYRTMIEKNYIIKDYMSNLLITFHFLLNGNEIDHQVFGDRFRQIESKATYKTHTVLNQYLNSLPKIS